MAEETTYYAIIDHRATREDPAGLARLRQDDEGVHYEALGLEGWHRSGIIPEWENGDASEDLIEVDADEAKRIIDRLKARWANL